MLMLQTNGTAKQMNSIALMVSLHVLQLHKFATVFGTATKLVMKIIVVRNLDRKLKLPS